MAAIDYDGILAAAEAILKADSSLTGIRIYVEEDPQLGGQDDGGRALVLTLTGRRPTGGQPLAAGKQTRYDVSFSLWAVGFDLASFREAAKKRDGIMGAAELVLMANRTLSNTVEALQLEGGEFMAVNRPGDSVYCSLGEIVVRAQARAINS